MKVHRTLVAAAVFALLLLVYAVDLLRVGRSVDAQLAQRRVVLLSAPEITSFTLQNATGAMSFERRDGHWWITRPFEGPADPGAAGAIVGNLAGAVKHHAFPKDEAPALSDYGLANPEMAIEVEGRLGGSDGKTERARLMVGASSTTGQYYATLDGEDEIFTINGYLRNQMARSPEDLRDRAVARTKPEYVQKIELRNSNGRAVIERDDQGDWKVVAPRTFAADDDWIGEWLADLAGARILNFLDLEVKDASIASLSSPTVVLTLEDDETTRPAASLVVGEFDEARKGYLARRLGQSQPFVIPEAVGRQLRRLDWRDFRRRELFGFSIGDVRDIEAEIAGQKIDIIRDSRSLWRFSDAPDIPVDQGKVKKLLNDLAFLEAEHFLVEDPSAEELSAFGLAPPRRRFVLTLAEPRRTVGLSLGNLYDPRAGLFYATTDATSDVVAVALSDPRDFLVNKEFYTDRRLFPDLDAPSIARITYEMGDAGGAITRVGSMAWRIETNDGAAGPLSDYHVSALLSALDSLVSQSELPAETRAISNIDWTRPLATIEIAYASPEKPARRLVIGDIQAAGSLAFVRTDDETYHAVALEDADAALATIEKAQKAVAEQ